MMSLYLTHGKGGLPALPAVSTLQDRYRLQAANERIRRLVDRQIRMMCWPVPGRLGHARWIARELDDVKAIR